MNYLEIILTSDDVYKQIKLNEDYIFDLIPELKSTKGFPHNHPHHDLDVYEHTLKAISVSEKNYILRMILLLHDIGKPFSYQDGNDGVRHFHGHGQKSSEIALPILRRLNFSEEDAKRMLYVIEKHDEIIDLENIKDRELELLRLKVQFADASAHKDIYVPKRINALKKIKEKL